MTFLEIRVEILIHIGATKASSVSVNVQVFSDIRIGIRSDTPGGLPEISGSRRRIQ